jgi:beta-glucosidase
MPKKIVSENFKTRRFFSAGTTILQAVRDAVPASTSVAFDPDINGTVPSADFGIVVLGEEPYAEYYGDDSKLELNATDRAVVRKVCDAMPCVVVLITGGLVLGLLFWV